jgi:hypothetical protein
MRATLIHIAAAAAAGAAAVRRHPGLVALTYLVQVLLSMAPAAVIFLVLISRFGHEPHFDSAMSGDLEALLLVIKDSGGLIPVALLLPLAIAAIYVVVSWLMTAGLIAVFADPPRSRAELASRFGGAAAARLGSFARLFAVSLVPYALVALLATRATLAIGAAARRAVSGTELALEAVVAALPAALLLWIVWTAIDYARVELTLAGERRLASWRALARAFRRVIRHPACLLHSGAGHLFAIAAGLLLWALMGWTAAAGIGLVALRQLALALRHLIAVAVLAGQVEIARRIKQSHQRSAISGQL